MVIHKYLHAPFIKSASEELFARIALNISVSYDDDLLQSDFSFFEYRLGTEC